MLEKATFPKALAHAVVRPVFKAADQKRIAERAIWRTTTYPRPDQSYPRGKKA
jgi:hypothetical protein